MSSDAINSIINDYIDNDDMHGYLYVYHGIKETYKDTFDTFYQKYVLDMPTPEERWERYCKVPSEWLEHHFYLIGILATVEVDNEERFVDLAEWLTTDRNRGDVFDIDTICELLYEMEDEIENDGDEQFVSLGYKYGSISYNVPITMDIIAQWKEQLIQKKVGSIRNDW